MGPRAPHHSTSMRCAIVLAFGLNLNFVLSASRRPMKGSRPGRGTACGAEARGGMGWGGVVVSYITSALRESAWGGGLAANRVTALVGYCVAASRPLYPHPPRLTPRGWWSSGASCAYGLECEWTSYLCRRCSCGDDSHGERRDVFGIGARSAALINDIRCAPSHRSPARPRWAGETAKEACRTFQKVSGKL